jgi:histidyl-tRNA synthetase
MTNHKLSTDPYKGVRDFYPEDMAIQRYLFDVWSATAEAFGFERYDASILEPAELYKSKGAENEEIINEQAYTFTDRGDREVILRPEMTPTVARMVAGKRRELQFPARWYSIPNLFRYERPQRGRLREHWQLNCDIFGGEPFAADLEILTLAAHLFRTFGATEDTFEIRVNSRALLEDQITPQLRDEAQLPEYLRLLDRKAKLSDEEFREREATLLKDGAQVQVVADAYINELLHGLRALGVTNAVFEPTITRGFDYYTGVVFEVFDISGQNPRALMGGGRYDNLTGLFGGEPVSGVGFGLGDVTMRDFLETHELLPTTLKATGPHVMVIPMSASEHLYAEQVAHQIRQAGFSVATDIGNKKVGEKISRASEKGTKFICVIGEDEATSNVLTLKRLASGEEQRGELAALVNFLAVE